MPPERVKTLQLAHFITPNSTYDQLQETVNMLTTDEIKRELGENAVELLINGMTEATTIIGPDPNNEYCWFSLEDFHDIISDRSKAPIDISTVETMAIFYADIGYMEIGEKDNLRILNPDLANIISRLVPSNLPWIFV